MERVSYGVPPFTGEATNLAACASLVEDAPLGIYVVQDGMIVFGNRWLNDFSGWMPEDLPLSCLEVIAPEDRAFVVDQMTRRARGEECLPSYAVRFLKRDGTVADVELVARMITWKNRPAIQGSIVDLSGKVAAELELRRYASKLEESNRFKELFNEILSHDLLNRLWVVDSCAALLADGPLTDSQSESLTLLRGALKRALGILSDATTAVRLASRDELKLETVRLDALVEDTVRDLRRDLDARDIGVELSVDGEPIVRGNPILREVVLNLLSNAAKYSPVGSVIVVGVGASADRVILRVADRGPGIPGEDRERVFERFERLEKGPIRGIGLGLAIVRRIVDLHGGRVWAEANPEGGTVFVVDLPAGGPGSRTSAKQ